MEHKSIALEPIEEKAIFPVSRIFYHLLVVVGALGAGGGLLFLLYSVTPTIKASVTPKPEPAPIKISVETVKANLQPKAETEPASATKPIAKTEVAQSKEEKAEPSKDEQRFQAAEEKLKALLPEAKYKWESTKVLVSSGFFGAREWRTTYLGVTKRLVDLIASYHSTARRAEVLESLAAVLAQFDEAERLEPLKAFIKLHREAEKARQAEIAKNKSEYKAEVAQAEMAYQQTELEKQLKRYQGLIAFGAGLASVAVIGIFLVLLSIQREVRKIASAGSISIGQAS